MRRTNLHSETKREEANWLAPVFIPENEEELRDLNSVWEEHRKCICGHTAIDHHGSWYPGGHLTRDECEVWGSNETGGMEYVDGKWIEHCDHFTPIP